MATFTRRPLGNVSAFNGRPVAVSFNTAPGKSIHLPSGTAGVTDMVTIFAKNTATRSEQLFIQWGGTTTNDEITMTIPPRDGLYLVVDNMPITGSSATISVYGGTSTGVSLQIMGYVDRIA